MKNELTAALATIEKCREIVGCPVGVDLQDHLRQLAAESVGLKDDVNIIINILGNGDWSDTQGYRGLKTEAGLTLESEIEKIVALIEPSPTTVIDAIDAHLLKIFQEERGGQLLQKVENNNWIPVSERMPEIRKNWLDVPVIIAISGEKHGSEALYCSDGKFRWGRDEQPIEDVTHWTPLPLVPMEMK